MIGAPTQVEAGGKVDGSEPGVALDFLHEAAECERAIHVFG